MYYSISLISFFSLSIAYFCVSFVSLSSFLDTLASSKNIFTSSKNIIATNIKFDDASKPIKSDTQETAFGKIDISKRSKQKNDR